MSFLKCGEDKLSTELMSFIPHSLTRYVLLLIFFTPTVLTYAEEPRPPFRVGMILSLTGKWAEFGEAQNNVIMLAKKTSPHLLEHIDFIIEDCQYQGKQAVSAFQKLREEDQVDIVFVWGVEPSLVLAPLAERYTMPLLVSGQLSKDVPEREYVVRTINYAEQYSAKLMDYLRRQ